MEGIELKTDGIVAWSYRWLTGKNHLPESFCRVFWLTLLSWLLMIIFSPVFLLTLLSKNVRKEPHTYSFFITFIISILILAILTIGEHIMTNTLKQILYSIVFMLIIVGVSLIFVGIMYVISKGFDWVTTKVGDWKYNRMSLKQKGKLLNKKIKTRKVKTRKVNKLNAIWTFFSVGIKSFMGKYCPRINWK